MSRAAQMGASIEHPALKALAASAFDAGALEPRPQPVELAGVLQEVLHRDGSHMEAAEADLRPSLGGRFAPLAQEAGGGSHDIYGGARIIDRRRKRAGRNLGQHHEAKPRVGLKASLRAHDEWLA